MKLRSGTEIIVHPIQPTQTPRQKLVKKCSFCKKTGHNISICNEKIEALIISGIFKFINSCETKEDLRDTLNRFILLKLKILVKHFKLSCSSQRKDIIVDELMPLCIANQTTQWINNYEIIKEILEENPGYSLTEIIDMKVLELYRNLNNRYTLYRDFTISNWFVRLNYNHQSTTIRREITNGYIHAINYIIDFFGMDEENPRYHWKIEPIIPRLYTESELCQIKQCPICYDDRAEINLMTTNCNHIFCNTCITTHLDTERNKRHPHCPMCRSIITTMNVKSITLFDEFSSIYNM